MDDSDDDELDGASPLAILTGGGAVLGACFASTVACFTLVLLATGSTGFHVTPLLTAQLAVALVGLIPAGLFAHALARAGRTAAVWFVVALVTYVAWGVLNDAAVHGWQHLKVFSLS